MGPENFSDERSRRLGLLEALLAIDPTLRAISASIVRKLGVYGRYRGNYTEMVSSDDGSTNIRVTLSVLHTGRHYADDLSDNSLIYHYPVTGVPGYDRSDIDAAKAALQLRLPIFVVLYPKVGDSAREVRVGYVVDSDDINQQFLIRFGVSLEVEHAVAPSNAAFAATVDALRKKRRVSQVRANDQAQFSFEVKKRYGNKCAVCDLRVAELLEAAHVIPVASFGSDDARNGIPLCRNHHAAFDADFFGFQGRNCEIVSRLRTLEEIGVTESHAATVTGALPHPAAVERCNELRKQKTS